MTDRERMRELMEFSPDGVVLSAQVTAAGLHRSLIQELVDSGELTPYGRGLYLRSNTWEDEYAALSTGAYGRQTRQQPYSE